MIDEDTRDKIRLVTEDFWKEHVQDIAFTTLASGKEIGHRIADYVDETTTSLLAKYFDTKREVDKYGDPRPRSMGDIWLKSNGIYNPINVKAGEAGKNGQPNMVSLTKLTSQLIDRQIDSYDLLIVKMRISGLAASADKQPGPEDIHRIVPNIYFVDMLDILDFVTFDAGPGQVMLKEKQFYDAADTGMLPRPVSLSRKVERCMELMEDGDRRLRENRRKKMDKLRRSVDIYHRNAEFHVNQNGISLG